eukprot:8486671-Pyramimonas_sp.AAC.1
MVGNSLGPRRTSLYWGPSATLERGDSFAGRSPSGTVSYNLSPVGPYYAGLLGSPRKRRQFRGSQLPFREGEL